MNYIGSKVSLLSDIEALLTACDVPMQGIAIDLFAGTSAVSQLFKHKGFVSYVNDWQVYSYTVARAFIELDTMPDFKALLSDTQWKTAIMSAPQQPVKAVSAIHSGKLLAPSPAYHVLCYLNGLSGKNGKFVSEYCEGGNSGRLYFSASNGQKIQAVRDQIQDWRQTQLVSDLEKDWLVASLLVAADKVANTASVYGAYLKHIKKSAQRPLLIQAIHPVKSKHRARHRVPWHSSGSWTSWRRATGRPWRGLPEDRF